MFQMVRLDCELSLSGASPPGGLCLFHCGVTEAWHSSVSGTFFIVIELGDWDLGEGVSEIRAQRRKNI